MATNKRTTKGPGEARPARERLRAPSPRADSIERASAQKGIQESEERFRKIFENAATGIAITDWQGHFQQCNPAYSAMLGYSEQELRQINFASLVHQEDLEANLAELQRLQTGEVASFEIENRYLHRDGQPIWVHKFVSVLPDETGKPAHMLALVTDITERKRTGAALRESEEKLRLFIEHAPAALAMFDRQMRYVAVSHRWLADYGLTDEKIIGRSHYEVFPEIPDRWRDVHRRGLEGEVVRADEDFFPRVDGRIPCLRWEVRPWKQADDTIGGIVILTEDLSARKQAEEALVQSEERFRLMADHAPVMIWMSGTDKLCTWFNKPWLAFVGRPMGQELGYGWSENAHPEDLDRCLHTYTTAFDARQPFTMEYRLQRHDGEYRWVLDNGIPVHNVSGEFSGYIGSCIDITERKRAEDRLRASEARMTAILTTATDSIITIDIHGIIQSVNPASERMFGYTAAEMLGHNVTMLMPTPYREEHDRYLDSYLRTGIKSLIGVGREVQARRKDGTTLAVDLAVSETAPLGLFTGILRDVSPRKQLEREVLEAAVDEQRRIGQELHDSVGQELTGLSLLADTLLERLETTVPGQVELAAKVVGGLDRVHSQIRALSHGLVSVGVDREGLRAALEELAARAEDQSGIQCSLECVGTVEVGDSIIASHLFRIAQEAVSNALRHGHPQNIRIALRGTNDTLALSVQDDGTGIAGGPEAANGLGTRLMRYRAGTIGGTLAIVPAFGGGTVVRCTVPRTEG